MGDSYGELAGEEGIRMADVSAPEPPREDWSEERGGRIDPMKSPDTPLDSDDRIDEAIAESFPASDPPSWNGGVEEE